MLGKNRYRPSDVEDEKVLKADDPELEAADDPAERSVPSDTVGGKRVSY